MESTNFRLYKEDITRVGLVAEARRMTTIDLLHEMIEAGLAKYNLEKLVAARLAFEAAAEATAQMAPATKPVRGRPKPIAQPSEEPVFLDTNEDIASLGISADGIKPNPFAEG